MPEEIYFRGGEDGSVHTLTRSEEHVHSPESTRAIVNRLSRAIGHLESVKKMVENERDCAEILVQLAAVRSAINNTGKVLIKEHISHCIVEAVESGRRDEIDELNRAIERFL